MRRQRSAADAGVLIPGEGICDPSGQYAGSWLKRDLICLYIDADEESVLFVSIFFVLDHKLTEFVRMNIIVTK